MTMVAMRNKLRADALIIATDRPSCEDVACVARGSGFVHVDRAARARVAASFDALVERVGAGETIYGVTTGVGALDGAISGSPNAALPLLRSHAAGIGPALDRDVVRAMLLSRICDLAAGNSGVQPATLDALVELLNRGVTPVVPSVGSVGASDLAPLAHAALVLAGEGYASVGGRTLPARAALAAADLIPVRLGWRDGLALINGLSLSIGAGALAVVDAQTLCSLAEAICAMAMVGMGSTTSSLAPQLDKTLPGSLASARHSRELLLGAPPSRRFREPLSTRCAHHIAGAARDAVNHARAIVEAELARPTDNPVVRSDGWTTSNAGNCDGSALAHVLDYLANAVTSLATASERRIARLLDPAHSGLPAFLVAPGATPGPDSGLMIAQYTAAAVVAELRTRAGAGVHTMPTCNGTEDHVSMSSLSARRALDVIDWVRSVLAIELLCAAQAVDLRGVTLTGELAELHAGLRAHLPLVDSSCIVGEAIEATITAIKRVL